MSASATPVRAGLQGGFLIRERIQVRSRALMAPMVGYNERPLREICRRFGSGLAVTEMIKPEKLLRGAPVRVVKTDIDLDEEGFMGLGDMYLFGSVLEHFLAQYVAANCLSQLMLRVPATGMQFGYPARGGGEVLL